MKILIIEDEPALRETIGRKNDPAIASAAIELLVSLPNKLSVTTGIFKS